MRLAICKFVVATGLLLTCFSELATSQFQKCGLGEASNQRFAGSELHAVRPEMHTSILVGLVRIHYDTAGINEPALLNEFNERKPGTAHLYADSAASIANRILAIATQVLGYLPPPLDSADGGGPEYDIYLKDLSLAYYGYTMPDRALEGTSESGRYTSFVVVDKDFSFISPDKNKGLPALRITLAHELFHAIQLGSYRYWFREMYYYELTATWIEDVFFPDVNDHYNYLTSPQGHFHRPEVSLTSNELIMYSRCLWSHYIAKAFGRDAIRRTWQLIRELQPLSALDSTLKEHSSNLQTAFIDWAKWNMFTGSRADTALYYPEGRDYPEIRSTGIQFIPPTLIVSDVLPCFSTRYYRIAKQETVLVVALTNVNTLAALTKTEELFPYSHFLNVTRLDSTYVSAGAGLFGKLEVEDPPNWSLQYYAQVGLLNSSAEGTEQPSRSSICQNYPNPFNPSTTIRFTLASTMFVSLKVYNVLGQEISTLVSEQRPPGSYKAEWNATDVTSGVYFCRLTTSGVTQTRKMILIR